MSWRMVQLSSFELMIVQLRRVQLERAQSLKMELMMVHLKSNIPWMAGLSWLPQSTMTLSTMFALWSE